MDLQKVDSRIRSRVKEQMERSQKDYYLNEQIKAAQKELGDIVYVELPEIEDEIDAGDEFGSIESVKAVSSLFMPMSGRVIATNTELKDSPEIINEECYDEGWVIRLELTNQEESSELLSSEDYKEFLLDDES